MEDKDFRITMYQTQVVGQVVCPNNLQSRDFLKISSCEVRLEQHAGSIELLWGPEMFMYAVRQ